MSENKNNMTQITHEIIRKIEFFPQQVGIPYEILHRLENPEITRDDFLNALEFDIVTTTNILKACNTRDNRTRFNITGKIGSLKEAARYIPLEELKKMISLRASTDIFARSSGTGYETGKGQIRRHSIACAVISKYLLPFAPPLENDLFTTCLLHDVGKMIMDECIEDSHHIIERLMDEKGFSFSEAEEEVLGLTHAEVGARILEKWHFPDQMIIAVRNHHHPEAVPQSPLTHFVALANIVAQMMGFSTDIDGMEHKGFPQLYKKYDMKEKHIEEILLNSIDEVKRAVPFKSAGPQEENNKK